MFLIASSLLPIAEFVEYAGTVIVIIGVVGEYVSNFTRLVKGKARKTRLEKISTLILIIGLAIELVGLVTTSHAFNLEVARANDDAKQAGNDASASYSNSVAISKQVAELNKEAADARVVAGNAEKAAGQANERAAKLDESRVMVEKDVAEARKEASDSKLFAVQIGTTNAQLVATNLAVEKQVEELQKKNLLLIARTITQSQLEAFTNILKGVLKCPVRVFVTSENEAFETENFAHQIRMLLDAAGYGVGKNVGIEKEKINMTIPFGITSDTCLLYFFFYGKQNEGIDLPNFKAKIQGTNQIMSFTVSTAGTIDLTAVPGTIFWAFQQIGMSPGIQIGEYSNFLKPGEWGIFIPQKL